MNDHYGLRKETFFRQKFEELRMQSISGYLSRVLKIFSLSTRTSLAIFGRNVLLLVGEYVLHCGRIVEIHVHHQQRNIDGQAEQVEQRHEYASVLIDLQ